MISPLPCNLNDPIKPGMAMRPILGIDACLVNEKVYTFFFILKTSICLKMIFVFLQGRRIVE
jgi:hypothetical protein